MSRPLVIAIDGPSGAGKGTVARAVASRLGYRHVDSGAMYRAVGWKALRDGVPLDDEAAVARLAEASVIHVGPDRVTIDGDDVTRAVRTPEIDRAAASVARLPKVRSVLVARQREFGENGGIVMEGRDIGTVVFPHADVKIYLDASRRRARPAARRGSRSLGRTDGRCRCGDAPHRARSAGFDAITSPLYAASDAIIVDTTGQSIDAVVAEVLRVINQRGLEARG